MNSHAIGDEIGGLVREVAGRATAAGAKCDEAWERTGRTLGISARRVRTYLYERVTHVTAAEYLTVRQRFDDWCDREAARLDAEAALLRARRSRQESRCA